MPSRGRVEEEYGRRSNGGPAVLSLGQWMNAVMSMKGDGGTMAVADAVTMIRATPPEDRSRFAHVAYGRESTLRSCRVV